MGGAVTRDSPPPDPCRAPHQYGPATRPEWHAWAGRMRETHELTDCPDCGLPVIWTPRDQPAVAVNDPGLFDLDGAQP